MAAKAKIGVLGASGYTGAELVRLLLTHPRAELVLLTADRRAGQIMADVFPQFAPYDLPTLTSLDAADWKALGLDLAFCALPHGTTQKVISDVIARTDVTKVVDLSADFRLADTDAYARWYGHAHTAPELQKTAVYGLTEIYRAEVGEDAARRQSRLLHELRRAGADPAVARQGDRSRRDRHRRQVRRQRRRPTAREDILFAEVSEGFHAYGVGHHRHMAELDQEFSKAAGPRRGRELHAASRADEPRHPFNDLCRAALKASPQDLHAMLLKSYANEPFVHVLPFGALPQTRHVRGSNMTFIGVAGDRISGRAIIVSTLDNLTKGASGQAVQNMNVVLGFPETTGIDQVALFP